MDEKSFHPGQCDVDEVLLRMLGPDDAEVE
jgi:hypothetical protein